MGKGSVPDIGAQPAPQNSTVSASNKFLEDAGYENISVDFSFPESLEGLTEKYGEKVVKSNAEGSFIISLQSNIRRWATALIKGEGWKEDDALRDLDLSLLQTKVDEWIPGTVNRTKKTKVDKGMALTDEMNEQEFDDYIAKLQTKRASLAS